MDPVTALAAATTAFNAIKKGFSIGKDVQSMAGDMSRWMKSIQDVKHGHEKEKKRKNRFATIEEEALDSWAAKKKAEQMENELRQFISLHYGPSAWQEIIRLQAEIRKQRQEEIDRMKRERQQIIEIILVVGLSVAIVGSLIYIGWLWKMSAL
jgi:nitrate reductase NapE component